MDSGRRCKQALGREEGAVEMIFVGNKRWTNANGIWQTADSQVEKSPMQLSEDFSNEMEIIINDVELVEYGDVNGVSTKLYIYSTDFNKSTKLKANSKCRTKVWIGVSDGLIYKEENECITMGDIKSKTSRVITYDNNISIVSPE